MLQSMRSAAKYVWIVLVVAFVGGYLLFETSGLMNQGGVQASTVVAKVGGRELGPLTLGGQEIRYDVWSRAVEERAQQESQRIGRALTLDERRRVEESVYDELVNNILLEQELARRGITVTDQEIQQAAQTSPPPELLQNPELQTEGRFDPAKYRRFMQSAAASQPGLLAYLENYYRSEIARQKLFLQIAGDVYVTDQRLWQMWQDTHDSAQVRFVALRPELVADSAVRVTDDEIRAHYEANRKSYDRPGRAVVSVLSIPRAVTAADTVAARERAARVRAELAGGAKFEDVAKRESSDSGSAAQGGELGRGGRGRFVPEFEAAAYALQPGELSQPVQTQFGFHVIRVDERKGDTLALRHVLIPIGQSDSSAARTDRLADALAKDAAAAEDPRRFDAAATKFGLRATRAVAIEDEPLTVAGRPVPSVSAWAFGGARVGETSDLFDAPDGYYLARLDSLTKGGEQSLDVVRDEIRRRLLREKKVAALVPRARQIADAARRGTLEAAAQAQGLTVERTELFTRTSLVPGLGQFTQPIGLAFGTPAGQIGGPVTSRDGVYVLRVDRRVNADKGAWQAQKERQREQVTQALRQARVQSFLTGLRERADVDDRREQIQAAARRQSAS